MRVSLSRLYVGTYTRREDHVDGRGEGIYCFELDESTGQLTLRHVQRGIVNPSFLVMAKGVLYAASEVTDPHTGGWVYAYAVDQPTGRLSLRGRQPSLGAAPCHLSIAAGHVLVANYLGGSVTVLPVDADRGLGPATDHVAHAGRSVHAERQQAPHPHAAVADRDWGHVLVPDLGTDEVVSYRLDGASGALERAGAVRLHAGAGPRHIALDRAGRRAYLMAELDSTVTAFSYAGGRLTPLETLCALPTAFEGTPSGADIHVGGSGRFLYASLRGPACIAVFRIGERGLKLLGHSSTRGRTPRNFDIHPSGKWLVVANQDSDSLEVFSIDSESGLLSHSGQSANVPSPACIAFG